MRKKGAEKILAVYWFAILLIVAGAIAYMVSSFYGNPYDIRDIEAGILTDKIASCVGDGGYLREDFFTPDFNENFLEKCGLTLQTEDTYGWKNNQYYLKLSVRNFNSFDDPFLEISEGTSSLGDFCGLEGATNPYCLKRSFYVIDKQQNQYQIDTLVIVRKTEKNVQ